MIQVLLGVTKINKLISKNKMLVLCKDLICFDCILYVLHPQQEVSHRSSDAE